jgi:opacity protein-like surface antigen
VLLAILSLLTAVSVARAQGSPGVHFGIAGGAAFPAGGASDLYNTGYHASAMLVFNAPLAPVGLRIEGMYARMKEKSQLVADGPVEFGAGTANLVLGPRALAFRPYFIGGGGFYSLRVTTTQGRAIVKETENKFGWNAGGGISFGVGPVASIFIEARYISVETDVSFSLGNNPSHHFTMVPVTIGFVF